MVDPRKFESNPVVCIYLFDRTSGIEKLGLVRNMLHFNIPLYGILTYINVAACKKEK